MKRSRWFSWPVLPVVCLFGVGAAQGEPVRARAVAVEPISAILDAFRGHQIVALGDVHGNVQLHAFLLSLIRDPRFPSVVNDVVVEYGSARYQDVLDRFLTGNDVPYELLREVWQNVVTPQAANDLPMYELFSAVRAVNASLPRERQVRVLLGDPPIDWEAVHDEKDHRGWVEMRDAYPAAVDPGRGSRQATEGPARLWARAPPAQADAQQL